MNKEKVLKYIIKIISIIITLILLGLCIAVLKYLFFSNGIDIIRFINNCGSFASIIFVLLQIIQVIFPIIPGGISCLVGVILFGPIKGFLYNYIGLSIGSIIVFFLSKKYGISLIKKVFSDKILKKYERYLNNDNYYKLFLCGILLPGAPDDLLCYLCGLTNIPYKKFISIILTCKPVTLIIYSVGWYYFPGIINLFV